MVVACVVLLCTDFMALFGVSRHNENMLSSHVAIHSDLDFCRGAQKQETTCCGVGKARPKENARE